MISSRKLAASALAVTAATAVLVHGGGAASAAASGCRPSITDLGDPLGGGFSFADGVNAAGTVVGSAFLPDGSGRAVVWSGGQVTDLGVIGKYDESFAHGVSDDGTVVGELNYQQRKAAPFIYSHGRMRKLPGLGGGFGFASGINSNDVIVGTASDATGHPHAVVWTDGGRTVHDLGIAPGDTASFASGINAAGTAVGDTDDVDGNERPAVFVDGSPTVLSVKKTAYGSAEDINDRDEVIGISFLPSGEQHAVVWRDYRKRGHDLGVLPGGGFASLVDIDNTGAAVGGGNTGRLANTTHAIYWPGSGPLKMLRPLSGRPYHDFAVARELDPYGNAVGGSANDDGEIHGTVWTCAAAQAVTPASDGSAVAASRSATLPAGVARAVSSRS